MLVIPAEFHSLLLHPFRSVCTQEPSLKRGRAWQCPDEMTVLRRLAYKIYHPKCILLFSTLSENSGSPVFNQYLFLCLPTVGCEKGRIKCSAGNSNHNREPAVKNQHLARCHQEQYVTTQQNYNYEKSIDD